MQMFTETNSSFQAFLNTPKKQQMTDLHFTPSSFLQNNTQKMTDRKVRGEHKDGNISAM